MDTRQIVSTVADARSSLSVILRRFRSDPTAPPVILGSHRRAEAALVPIAMYEAMRADGGSAPTGTVLSELRQRKALIERLALLSNIRSVSVFGSVARGTETPSSDIDLLVEPNDQAGLFDLAQFSLDMEQLTGRPVDVVSRRSLREEEDAALLGEAIGL